METNFINVNSMQIAYREFGNGKALVLCNRFRGTLDTWDPLFLSELAKESKVIIFDYPQVGYSEGTFPEDVEALSDILVAFCKNLGYHKIALAGWSFGGFVAQAAAFQHPELVESLILIGTNPPGENLIPLEPIFLEKALLPVNSLEDEHVLFFEPDSEFSLASSIASHDRIYKSIDVSKIPSTQEEFGRYFVVGNTFKEDTYGLRAKMLETNLPILVLHGDHDVSFAVENWFPLLRKLKNGQFIFYTKAGHGPQHQLPELSASYLNSFVKYS